MMFDAMCRLAERAEMGRLISRLRYASLLVLGESKNAGWADVPGDSVTLFRLPWKATAIEDSLSCVLMERIGTTTIRKVSQGPKGWIGVVSDVGTTGGIRDTTADVGLEDGDTFFVAMAATLDGVSSVVAGAAVFGGLTTSMEHVWAFQDVSVAAEVEGKVHRRRVGMDDPGYWPMTRELTSQLVVATWQCVVATQPGSWVLRKVDAKVSPEGSPKIPRSHQRPTWVVISDAERKRVFRERDPEFVGTEGEHSARAAHPRRAHYRCVGEHEGKRRYTWVRACWVGSNEAEIRGGRYRVEVDL